MRYSVTAAIAVLLTMAGCEQAAVPQGDTPATGTPAETTAVEAAPAPVIHHWTNDREIGGGDGPVNTEHLLSAPSNPEQWLHYGGDYANHRHSPIDDITPENASQLKVALGVPHGDFPAVRSLADGVRRHHVRDHLLQPNIRARCGNRRDLLALRPSAARGSATLLRDGEPGGRHRR